VRGSAFPRTLLLGALTLAACGRTALEPFGKQVTAVDAAPDLPVDRAPDVAVDLPSEHLDALPDLPVDRPAEHAPPACVPAPELCNGVDDDCNGVTDENQPAIPCPNGGNQYCVAGRYSDCPRRCEVCVPGSARTCFTSFCTFWGREACAMDGRSFGPCMEERAVPPECQAVAQRMQRSKELEQCCLDNGYCCVDSFDLDDDGDRAEMLGNCEAVECAP
jgi:hypothetical protein